MRKYLLYSTLVIFSLITAFIIYLSVFGIKTEKFNDLIKDKVKIIDPKLSININDVLTITLTLFAVVDILGSIPLIINIRQKAGHINSLKATIVSLNPILVQKLCEQFLRLLK